MCPRGVVRLDNEANPECVTQFAAATRRCVSFWPRLANVPAPSGPGGGTVESFLRRPLDRVGGLSGARRRGAASKEAGGGRCSRARAQFLSAASVDVPDLVMWSHDGLDALLAAAIASDVSTGRAVRVTCGHDDSAIWLNIR